MVFIVVNKCYFVRWLLIIEKAETILLSPFKFKWTSIIIWIFKLIELKTGWTVASHSYRERMFLVYFAHTSIVKLVPLVVFKAWSNKTVVVTAIKGTAVNQNRV